MKTVSEWINNGAFESNFYLLENVAKQTEKAIGFHCSKEGNVPAICWLPKSQIKPIKNDYYPNGDETMFLIPSWLYNRKTEEGYFL